MPDLTARIDEILAKECSQTPILITGHPPGRRLLTPRQPCLPGLRSAHAR